MDPATIAALASLAGGGAAIFGATKAGKGASASSEAQRALMIRQASFLKEQEKFWKESIRPVLEATMAQALVGVPAELFAERAGVETGRQFERGLETIQRRQEAAGIDPTSPASLRALADFERAKQAAIAGARTRAFDVARDVTFQRRLAAAGVGQQIPGQVSAGLGQLGAQYGGIAQQQALAAGQMAQLGTQLGLRGLSGLQNLFTPPTTGLPPGATEFGTAIPPAAIPPAVALTP